MKEKTAKKILKKVIEDYDNISSDFNKTRRNNWEEFEKYIPYIQNEQTVADLGCGNGRLFKFIQKHRKTTYVGIDNSRTLLEKAKEYAKEYTKHETENSHKFIKGDLLNIPLEDSSIDTALAVASFHHIPSIKLRKESLEEIKRILKENGLFIVTVWNLFQPKYKKYIWKSRLKHILSLGNYESRGTLIPWAKTGVKRYYYAFIPKELEELLKESGFEILNQEIGKNITFICKKIR